MIRTSVITNSCIIIYVHCVQRGTSNATKEQCSVCATVHGSMTFCVVKRRGHFHIRRMRARTAQDGARPIWSGLWPN